MYVEKFMKEIIDGMNQPYGKSCIDKLCHIRNEGYVLEYDNYNILPE